MADPGVPDTQSVAGARAQGVSSERAGARSARRVATRLMLLFLVTAGPWVLFSDLLLASIGLPRQIEQSIASAKGVFFVIATAVILYGLAVGHLRSQYAIQERYRRLFENAGEGLMVFRVEARPDGYELSVESSNPAQAARLGKECSDIDGMCEGAPCCSRLGSYFAVVRRAVETGDIVREEATFDDGDASELLMAYPIQSDLWVMASMDISDLRAAERELKYKEERIRQAYVDVLDAVTGGKLLLLREEEIRDNLGEPVGESHELQELGNLAEARASVREAVASLEDDPGLISAVVSASGEAFNNALKHAGSGEYGVYRKDGVVQVCVSDAGTGIDFRNLPKVALVPGFSTAQTLGMGFTIMLQLTERILLFTRPGRTEVVLEFSLQ